MQFASSAAWLAIHKIFPYGLDFLRHTVIVERPSLLLCKGLVSDQALAALLWSLPRYADGAYALELLQTLLPTGGHCEFSSDCLRITGPSSMRVRGMLASCSYEGINLLPLAIQHQSSKWTLS
eukprot:5852350-Amphidinium_carterae.1